MEAGGSQLFPRLGFDVRLVENISKSADGNFLAPGNDGCIRAFRRHSDRLYVASLLTDLLKPISSRRRLTSRNGSGLSRSNLYLNLAYGRRVSGNRRFKMKFERLAKVCESLLFCPTLARDIQA